LRRRRRRRTRGSEIEYLLSTCSLEEAWRWFGTLFIVHVSVGSWKVLSLRVLANFLVLFLLIFSSFAVIRPGCGAIGRSWEWSQCLLVASQVTMRLRSSWAWSRPFS
jgi:hypothetical protein